MPYSPRGEWLLSTTTKVVVDSFITIFLLFCLSSSLIISFTSAKNYVIERTEVMNGHVYRTRWEQPWYRVHHDPHTKVFRDSPMAGRLNPEQIRLANEQYVNWQERMSEISSAPADQRKAVEINGIHIEQAFVQPMGIEVFIRQRHPHKQRTGIFGHHNLPKGEVKDTAKWPHEIWPFMACMTLECECPLFRGKVVGDECILPSGKPLKKAIRKELRTLTPEELNLFITTMRKFRDSGLYHRMGLVHRRSGVHSGPSFLTWHREYLKRLEMVYRSFYPPDLEDNSQGLPYWDSTMDGNLPSPEQSIMFSDYLLGENNDDGEVISGLFANWTTMDGRYTYTRLFGLEPDGEMFNEGRIDWILEQTRVDQVLAYTLPLHTCLNYTVDDRFLEYSHDYVHYFLAGDMLERFSSSNDPLFFMHHGFIDFIWEMWRQTKQTRAQREREYPRDDSECMPEWHFAMAFMPMLQPMRNVDALSNKYTDNLYEYAPRPRCKGGRSEECGNTEWLFCDTRSDPDNFVCSAKVRPGGNCAGFEWSTEVCYKGRCINGLCTGGRSKPRRKNPLSGQQHLVFDANGQETHGAVPTPQESSKEPGVLKANTVKQQMTKYKKPPPTFLMHGRERFVNDEERAASLRHQFM